MKKKYINNNNKMNSDIGPVSDLKIYKLHNAVGYKISWTLWSGLQLDSWRYTWILTGLQLSSKRQQVMPLSRLTVFISLDQNQQLRSPVLHVRRPFLQLQQRKPGGRHRQATNTITPLLLSSTNFISLIIAAENRIWTGVQYHFVIIIMTIIS